VKKSYLLRMILLAGIVTSALALASAAVFASIHFRGTASCPSGDHATAFGTCSSTGTVQANY
jgi:hypothetical protein